MEKMETFHNQEIVAKARVLKQNIPLRTMKQANEGQSPVYPRSKIMDIYSAYQHWHRHFFWWFGFLGGVGVGGGGGGGGVGGGGWGGA